MKILFVSLFIVFFSILTCSAQSADKVFPEKVKNLKNPIPPDASVIKRGTKIYLKSCWTCHGDNGMGNGPQSREISTNVADFNDDIVRGRTDGELYWWILTGGNDMESFKDLLSEEEVWALVNYIRSLQNLPEK